MYLINNVSLWFKSPLTCTNSSLAIRLIDHVVSYCRSLIRFENRPLHRHRTYQCIYRDALHSQLLYYSFSELFLSDGVIAKSSKYFKACARPRAYIPLFIYIAFDHIVRRQGLKPSVQIHIYKPYLPRFIDPIVFGVTFP